MNSECCLCLIEWYRCYSVRQKPVVSERHFTHLPLSGRSEARLAGKRGRLQVEQGVSVQTNTPAVRSITIPVTQSKRKSERALRCSCAGCPFRQSSDRGSQPSQGRTDDDVDEDAEVVDSYVLERLQPIQPSVSQYWM